jgi:hypothetical protein
MSAYYSDKSDNKHCDQPECKDYWSLAMPNKKTRIRKASQTIPRIGGKKAAAIFATCEQLLTDGGEVRDNLSHKGFTSFLELLTDEMLQLALQPDSSGERLRAFLVSRIMADLQGDRTGQHMVNVDDIVYCANILMPCFLLELGRRRQNLEIEFPTDPTDSSASFRLRTGKSHPLHSINSRHLVAIVSKIGEELVGLCYFGDKPSRERVEAELEQQANRET